MAEQVRYALNNNMTYSSGGTSRLTLPLSGYITHIDMVMKVTVTTAGSTIKEDAFHRLLKSFKIQAAGTKNFVDFSDGRQLKYYSYAQYAGGCQEDLIAGTAVAGVYRCHMPLHLGFAPRNQNDQSVVIPAAKLQDLVATAVWGSPTDIAAAGASALSAQIDFVVTEIVLAPGEPESSIWQNGLISPRFEPKIYTAVAGTSSLGWTHDLPVGDTLYRVVFMQLDTDVRTDDVATTGDCNAIGFKFPKTRKTPLEEPWFHRKAQNKLRFGFPSVAAGAAESAELDAPVGVAYFDGSEFSGREAGLDLTRANVGDVQLAASVGTGTPTFHILHVMYQ